MKLNYLYSVLIISLFIGCQASPDQDLFPPEGKVLTFVHELDYPNYFKHNLPELAGVALYSSPYGDVSFRYKNGEKAENLNQLLDHIGDVPLLIMLRLTNKHMKQIANGEANFALDTLAMTLKDHKNTIYLAVGYEVNNPRYALSISNYLKAHRILVERLRASDLQNVAYGWHLFGMKAMEEALQIPIESCYPGDDYVDWLGLSVYTNSVHQFAEDAYFNELIIDEAVLFAADHDLKIMLCESNAHIEKKQFGYTGDSLWVDWYEPLFKIIRQHNIFAHSHIFYDFNDPVILLRWEEQLKQEEFILARSGRISVNQN
jgi:hypothetical protein